MGHYAPPLLVLMTPLALHQGLTQDAAIPNLTAKLALLRRHQNTAFRRVLKDAHNEVTLHLSAPSADPKSKTTLLRGEAIK